MRASILSALILALALGVAGPAPARADDAAKAIAIMLALGIGLAAASQGHAHHSNTWDTDRYGEPFSPHKNVVCLPKPRQCYENGRISWRWTKRIFG